MPTISIVIVNFENWELLKRCLDSLKSIELAEIVVVDNCSPTDKLSEFSNNYPNIHFIKNTGNNGFANACNLGATNSKGEYLFFLNPDAVGSEDLLLSLLKTYQDINGLSILGVVQVNEKGKTQAFEKPFPSFGTILGWTRSIIANRQFQHKIYLNNVVEEVPWVSGAAVFISQKWFEDIGGWDEDFWMYFEDTALSKKAKELGGKVGILLKPTLLHAHGGSSRINPKTTASTKLEVMISRHVYISKYVKSFRTFTQGLAVVNHLILCLLQSVIGLVLFFTPKGRMYLRLLVNLLSYYLKAIFSKRWKSARIV
jgi:GT2 family glycosyltransferase